LFDADNENQQIKKRNNLFSVSQSEYLSLLPPPRTIIKTSSASEFILLLFLVVGSCQLIVIVCETDSDYYK
jgi:hypothetical protein